MKKWAAWGGATVLLAAVFVLGGLGHPVPSLVAAMWLILLPALSATREFPPGERIRDARVALYLSSAVALIGAGGLTFLAWGGLGGEEGFGVGRPPAWAPVFGVAALLTGAGLMVAYLFRGLSALRGWRETEAVHAIMPVTGRERRFFTLLTAAAGWSEEVVFRGFLPAFLTPWFGSYLLAALPVNAAFGILHGYQGSHGMARAGVMGLAFAIGVAWTGSLWPSILAHTALNLLIGLVLHRSLLGGFQWTLTWR